MSKKICKISLWEKRGDCWTNINSPDLVRKLQPDLNAIQTWEDANKAKIQKVLSAYETEWKDKYTWPKLMPEDGR